MKALLLSSFALLAGANLSAQEPRTPATAEQRLERAQLLEEREGDLAAAEKAYRELLADAKASTIRLQTSLRLGALLWRLDRRDEAEPLLQRAAQANEELATLVAAVRAEDAAAAQQQQEREQRARALVDRMVELCYEEPAEVDDQVRHITQQMASLPEATATVLVQWLYENRRGVWVNGPNGKGAERILTSLLSTLWSVGTPPAADYLTAVAQGDELPWQRFVTKVAATRERTGNELLVAMDAFTRTPDPTREVQANIVSVLAHQPYDRVLPFMLAGNPDTALVGLKALNRAVTTAADGQRVLAEHGDQLVSWATGDSTEFADAAIRFLFDRQAASLLLKVVRAKPERAPRIRNNNWYLHDGGDLIRELAQTAQVLGPYPLHAQPTTAQLFVAMLLVNLQLQPAPAAVPAAIALASSHYGIGDQSCNWLQSACSVADASQRSQILRAIPVLGHPSAMVARLAARAATAELFEPIRDTVAAIASDPAKRTTWGQTVGALIQLAARTGHPESTAWILDQLDAWPSEVVAKMRALLTCSQVHPDEAALEGLRRVLLMQELDDQHRGVVFGELVRRGDVATIAIMSEAMQLGMRGNNPLRTGALLDGAERDGIADAYEAYRKQFEGVYVQSAVEFLADRVGRQTSRSRRWHGYGDQHLIAAWRGLLTGPASSTVWSWLTSSDFPLSRCLLPLLAEQLSSHDYKGTIVLKCLGETLGSLTPSAVEEHPELRDAVHTLLGLDAATADSTFRFLNRETAQLFADVVRERLSRTGEVGWIAQLSEKQIPVGIDDWTNALRTPDSYAILAALPPGAPAELEAQVSALLRAPNPMTRAAAIGAMARAFSQRAAAALLPMLQDADEGVRKAAREQLDLLREAQEQRQFWARVQGGVDLTPQATSQKLVQQAQPDQPSAQRVLAIRSLAAVGATEALPLLIEWSKDQDAAVKAAADAAIAAILQKAEASK